MKAIVFTRFRLILQIVFFFTFINSTVMADSWEKKADMPMPRYRHKSVEVNGKIYVIGGYNIGVTKRVQAYDPATDTWIDKASMPVEMSNFSICAIDEKIYVIKGSTNAICDLYEYDTLADTWTKKADLPTTRRDHEACSLDEKIYVIGGSSDAGVLKTVEIYDPKTDRWTKGKDMLSSKTQIAVESANGKIYAMGGLDGNLLLSGIVEEFDPNTGLWRERVSIPRPRYNLATCVLEDRIYVIGGMVQGKKDWENVGTVEEYNPSQNRWSLKATMPTPRSKHSACSSGANIYVFGGVGENWEQDPLSTVEKYNPWPSAISPEGDFPATWGNIKRIK